MEVQSRLYEEKNRLSNVVALIAITMAFARKREVDAVQLVESADSKDWELYAKLASLRNGYVPSEETRALVRKAIREAQRIVSAPTERLLCISCALQPAVYAAGKSGRRGTDLCDFCWKLETDHGADGAA